MTLFVYPILPSTTNSIAVPVPDATDQFVLGEGIHLPQSSRHLEIIQWLVPNRVVRPLAGPRSFVSKVVRGGFEPQGKRTRGTNMLGSSLFAGTLLQLGLIAKILEFVAKKKQHAKQRHGQE
jgi:hypothetical protein